MDNMQGNEPMISEPVGAEPVGMGVDSAAPVFTDEKKSGKGMLLGLVLCLVLAVGGIGFGVWAMMDGNARADKLNKQITNLNSQIATLQEQAGGENGVDAWNNFSSSLSSQSLSVRGNYYHYNGSDNELYWMGAHKDENGHLAITDYGDNSPNYDAKVVLELDGVLMVYYVEVGNGGVPYFYIIDSNGGVSRLDIMETSERQLEKVGDYDKIVTVSSASSLEAILVDIDGNIYKSV